MGFTRKMLSVTTLGAVDFYSDKERIARNTKATAKAAREQVRLAKAEARRQKRGDG